MIWVNLGLCAIAFLGAFSGKVTVETEKSLWLFLIALLLAVNLPNI